MLWSDAHAMENNRASSLFLFYSNNNETFQVIISNFSFCKVNTLPAFFQPSPNPISQSIIEPLQTPKPPVNFDILLQTL